VHTFNKILCATALWLTLSTSTYAKDTKDAVENIISAEKILPEQTIQEDIPTVSLWEILYKKIPPHHIHNTEVYIVRSSRIGERNGIRYYATEYDANVHASFDVYEGKQWHFWVDVRNGAEDFDAGRDDFFEAFTK